MAFTRALQLSAFVNAVHILRTHGRPRFNKHYGQSVVMDETSHFLFVCVILFSSRPFFLALVPVASRAALFLSRGLTYALSPRPASATPSPLAKLLLPLLERVTSRFSDIWQFNAQMEVWTGLLLIINLVSSERNLLLLFIYWQYLRMRHMLSPHSRAAFTALGASIDQYCPGALKPIVGKVQAFLSNQVRVPRNAEEAKAMQPSCTIM